MTGQNPFANNDEVEITADIESATKTSFYVNGQKAFTAYTGMSYLPSEIRTFGTIQQPFRTMNSKPYDPQTNSITIGVGQERRDQFGASFADLINSGQYAKNRTPVVNRIIKKRNILQIISRTEITYRNFIPVMI